MKKKVLFLFLFLILLCFQKSSQAWADCETRGSWINNYALERSDVNTVINNLVDANLNTVFVLAPNITTSVPGSPCYGQNNRGWSNETDFRNFIETMANDKNFSVHAWVVNMERSGQQADFTSATEQQCQADWAVSLLDKYSTYLAGIHFDYIRYPTSSSNNLDKSKMDGVSATVKKAHDAIKAKYPNKVLTAAVFTAYPNSLSSGEQNRPTWFLNWLAANPDYCDYSVCYDQSKRAPDHMIVQQDPVGWIKDGNIEGVIPMMYVETEGLSWTWNDDAETWKSFLEFGPTSLDKEKVFMGIGFFKDDASDTVHGDYSTTKVTEEINYQRSIGLKGSVIFEFSNIVNGIFHNDTDLVNVLRNGPYHDWIQSCLTSGPQTSPTTTPTPVLTPIPTPTPTLPIPVVNVRVSQGSDDAEEAAGGGMYLTSTDLELVQESTTQTVGIRFQNISISQGASITNAYVQFTVDETSSEATSLTIHGEKGLNPSTFTSANYNISSRTRTNASVSWNPPAWDTIGQAGVNQQTPDLKSIIQEIINQNNWQSGNALAFLITGTGRRVAEAYEGSSNAAPLLHVEYSTTTHSLPLSQGWNEIVWPNISGKKASDIPPECPMTASKEDFWFKPYVRNYGGGDFEFEEGKTYHLRCNQEFVWNL